MKKVKIEKQGNVSVPRDWKDLTISELSFLRLYLQNIIDAFISTKVVKKKRNKK